MSLLPKTRSHLQLLVAIFSFCAFVLLGVPRVEAVAADRVKIQLIDNTCTADLGTARGNPSGDNVWSSWASDSDDWDPDCVRLWLDDDLETQTDVRYCIQSDDDGGLFGAGGGVSNTVCTPWASEGGGWSSWAADPDKWAYDRIHIKVDTQALSGRYVSNFRLGFQNTRALGDICGDGNGTAAYTPYKNAGGGWSGWADVANEGAIACSRINLSSPTILGLPCDFAGGTDNVASGASVTAYAASSVPYGSSCTSQTRTCTNGVLSGTYANASCSVAAPANCTFASNQGNIPVNHGSSVTAYSASSVAYGTLCSSVSQSRTCSNGTLSGTYANSTCSVAAPANCTLTGDSTPVAHGVTATAYQTGSVPYGSTCASQSRTCSNGSFTSGTYTYGNCSVAAPLNCNINGTFVAHGSSPTFYTQNPLPYGTVCGLGNSSYAGTRGCSNGTPTGNTSYSYGTCTVDSSQQPLIFTANGIATTTTVRKGSFVRLAWNGLNSSNCSINGVGGFVSTSTPIIPTNTNPTAISGSTWVQVNSKSVLTFRCTSPSSKELSATINLVPELIEI
jgi:hypothetical protein